MYILWPISPKTWLYVVIPLISTHILNVTLGYKFTLNNNRLFKIATIDTWLYKHVYLKIVHSPLSHNHSFINVAKIID